MTTRDTPEATPKLPWPVPADGQDDPRLADLERRVRVLEGILFAAVGAAEEKRRLEAVQHIYDIDHMSDDDD